MRRSLFDIRQGMRWTLIALIFVTGFHWTGCAPVRDTRVGAGVESGSSLEIRADAYLFEALLRRDGKPTTFQLEVYRTDTLLGLSGKGYLGKGALRGRLTADSLEVYFPSTHEYLLDAIDNLADSSGCEFAAAKVRLLDLFQALPDSIDLPVGLSLSADRQDTEKPVFVVAADSCAWRVEIGYDLQDGAWRIREFDYSDDSGTSLSGQRIRYRGGAKVKLKSVHGVDSFRCCSYNSLIEHSFQSLTGREKLLILVVYGEPGVEP